MQDSRISRENRELGVRLSLAHEAYSNYRKKYKRWAVAYRKGKTQGNDALLMERDSAARKAMKEYEKVNHILRKITWKWTFGE